MILANNLTREFCSKGAVLALCGLGLLLMPGCQAETDAAVETLRHKILTDRLPSDVMSLAEANAGFEEGMKVRVVGRIFADGMSPFDRESAAFNLIELPKPGHNHEDPGDCPFCKREMQNAANAIVQVVDDSGQVLETPAERLLALEKNQDIVAEGKATKVGEFLIVNATSLHILKEDDALLLAKRIHGKLED